MKQLARRYLWWPGLDKEIEETVKLCHSCQEAAKHPPAPNPASWSWPGGPWKRLHLDFAGPYLSKMYLVIVDAYSKFVEVVPMGQATKTNTIASLRRVFSCFGLPDHLVTDNSSQFTSAEFQKFLKENDIEHIAHPVIQFYQSWGIVPLCWLISSFIPSSTISWSKP